MDAPSPAPPQPTQPWHIHCMMDNPSLSAEELRHRANARVYVKRAYEKKKNTLMRLRADLERLEHEYKRLLQLKSLAIDGGHEEESESPSLVQRYMKLTALKQTLYDGNEELQAMNAERMIRGDRLQQLVDSETQPLLSEMPLYFQPLPDEEYMAAVRHCQQVALAFDMASGQQTSGLNFLGWTDRRQVAGDLLTFSCEKTFSGISARELMQRSWRILSTPSLYQRLHSASLQLRLHVLQHVNADVILYHWTMCPCGSNLVQKVVYLVARVPIPGGFLILFRSIDKDRVAFDEDGINEVIQSSQLPGAPSQAGKTVYWLNLESWIVLRDVPAPSSSSSSSSTTTEPSEPSASQCHFGGSSRAQIWLVEVMLTAMRWEHLVVGSHLLPAPSTDSETAS